MPYKIHVDPTPLHAGMGFEVRLEITPPDVMKAGDIYEIRELGGQPVVFDVGQVTVPAGAAGPATLVFRSNAGFPAAVPAQIAVFNTAAPAVPVAQTMIHILATNAGWFGRGMAFVAGWGTIIMTGLFFVAVGVALVLLPLWAAGLIASHGTPNPAGSVADGSPISKNKPANAAPKGDAGNASPP